MDTAPISNFKEYLQAYFPEQQGYVIEIYLDGQVERNVLRCSDKSTPTRIEWLYLPDNGAYQHLLQVRVKHPQAMGTNRLQNSYPVSMLPLPEAYSTEQATQLLRNLRTLLEKGWEEVVWLQGKTHVCSTIHTPFKQQWTYWIANQQMQDRSGKGFPWWHRPMLWMQGLRAERRHIAPQFPWPS